MYFLFNKKPIQPYQTSAELGIGEGAVIMIKNLNNNNNNNNNTTNAINNINNTSSDS